jgi:hypothetical protein
MPELLVLPAVVKCDHDGVLTLKASQEWAVVHDAPVLRQDDPEG